ncbi:MAG TPA: DNA-binding protein [Kosmotogaceae bacterium]|nr:DNA-binding protein [Kosmotogaceae bacterium]
MKADHEELAIRWLRQAKSDLEDPGYLFEGSRYHLACFISQQASEKALKAYLYAQGAGAVWGHSASELCADASRSDKGFLELKHLAALLDTFYIPTRYPDALPEGIPADMFAETDAEKAIKASTRIVGFVKDRISPSSSANSSWV